MKGHEDNNDLYLRHEQTGNPRQESDRYLRNNVMPEFVARIPRAVERKQAAD